MIRYAITYGSAFLGVIVFHLLHLPLPWLLGPIFALLIAAFFGLEFRANKTLGNLMRTILGVAVGATISMELMHKMLGIWPSLLLVILMVITIGVIGVWYFYKLCHYDFPTAYYGAMPGGLQDMLVFGEEAGANVRTLSLIHATRVLVIVATLPLILQFFWHVDLHRPPGEAASNIPISQMAWMVFAAIAGWQIAARIGLFGATILGPLIMASILSLIGVLHHRPPAEAIYAAQFFIGVSVGVKYVNITIHELRRDVLAALGYTVLLAFITAFYFEIVELFHIAPPMDALLSFTPGGQAEMAVLALITGADMGFVVAHHVLRIFVVIIGAPVAKRLLRV